MPLSLAFKTTGHRLTHVMVMPLLMSSPQTISKKGNHSFAFLPAQTHGSRAIRIPTSIPLRMGYPPSCLLSASSPSLAIKRAINHHPPAPSHRLARGGASERVSSGSMRCSVSVH